LRKDELIRRLKFHCVHRHTGLDYPECYDQAHGKSEKVGFLDIETSNLNADFGIVLSWCIKEEGGRVIKRIITSDEIRQHIYDKNLLKDFCQQARQFSRLITYYGTRFDIPFLRTRCLFWNLPFPVYKELNHSDAYIIMKHRFNLHSKRLGVVAPFFKIPAKEHPLNPEIWFRCMSGDKRALAFVLTHNTEDVVSLEGLWEKISKFARIQNTSI